MINKYYLYVCLISSILLTGCAILIPPDLTSGEYFFMGKHIGPVSFSPNKEKIVFTLSKNNISKIYTAKINGAELTELSNGETNDFDPVYSLDGKKILFASSTDKKQCDLAIMNNDGSNKIFLTNGESHDINPLFSPDGTKIYFIRAEWFGNYSPIARPSWHKMDIYSINTDGTDLVRITRRNFYSLSSLSIHPDNKKLLAKIRGGGLDDSYSIWTLSIDNQNEFKPFKPNFEEFRTWVPILNKIPIDYSTLSFPKFSPNGKSIIFTKERELYSVDTQSKEMKLLIKTSSDKIVSIWAPNYSADNKKIIFIYWEKLDHYRTAKYPFMSGSTRRRIGTINQDGTDFTPIEFFESPETNTTN